MLLWHNQTFQTYRAFLPGDQLPVLANGIRELGSGLCRRLTFLLGYLCLLFLKIIKLACLHNTQELFSALVFKSRKNNSRRVGCHKSPKETKFLGPRRKKKFICQLFKFRRKWFPNRGGWPRDFLGGGKGELSGSCPSSSKGKEAWTGFLCRVGTAGPV